MTWMNDLEAKQLAMRKAEMERRRFVECLTSARINIASAHKSVLNADLWASDEQAPRVKALYEQAEQLHKQIEALLKEAQEDEA